MRSRVPAGRLVAVLAATAACGAGAIASAATSDFSASQRATIDVVAAKKAKKKPDLTVKALASAPAKVARKGHLTVSATVANTGKRKAGKSILGLYLAHARVHTKGDAQIGLLAVPALRPRRKKKLAAALTVPATLAPGKYFVIACADATKKVKEKSERNNCRATTTATTVTAPQKPPPKPPPDLPGSDKPVPKPPPPPSAPPLTAPGGSTMKDSTKFLYEGANPVQTGVSAGTIDAARVGVIRGRVLKDDGTPLPSVTVTVAGHPALGQTVTRSDGRYDLAINAGGPVTLHFERPTYLPVERQVDPPVRDYDAVDDVVMRQFDAKVTPLTPGAADAQVARSSTTTDSSGSRRANLILMPGTHASMKMPDNSTKPLSSLHVRATEYTTGSRGPEAMPGDLPPTSAYTYAVDYSVDEAVDAGAKTVLFDQPVVVYTDNFIGMPVGTTVPLGSYDQTKHAWVPEANGIVLKIVSITGGAADVDVDGDGAADTGTKLTDLGITDTERVQLAKLYSAGASLWRASVTHFSALDQNWPWGPPGGAGGPGGPNGAGGPNGGGGRGGGGRGGDPSPNCSPPSGSAIDCGYQALRESLEVAGTPFTLNYTSARAPRASQRQIVIPLTSATPPGPLKRVELDVETAGQATHLQFDGAPNQTYTYEWNGRDAYGRTLNTTTNSLITIAYVYDAVYRTTPLSQAFAQYGDSLSAVKARKEVKFTAQYLVKVGTPPSPPAGLGGWTLDVHHALDTQAELVQLGTGDTMAAPARHQSRLLVNYQDEYDPGTESQATISAPVWQPDGSIWFEETHYTFSSEHHAFVKRVAPDGTISTIASFPDAAYPGYNDAAMTRAPDGGVYVMFRPNNGETPVLHVAPGGDVTPVTAGTLNGSDSPTPNAGDGQPAAQVVLDSPQTLATGPDGSLYIAERVAGPGARIQKIEPDGVLRTVLTPSSASPAFFAVGPDGSLYIGDGEIHRIDPSGRDEIVLGDHSGGTICCAPGQVAKDAALPSSYMRGLAVQNDGTLVFSNGDFIWTVDAQGKLVRLAGRTNGASITDLTPKEAALGASFGSAGMTVGPNGSLAVAAPYGLRTIEPAVGGFALDHLIPSRNGQEVYRFDVGGRHVSTLDALTGVPHETFAYDGAGLLKSITDRDGRVTSIERDSSGKATAIVAPNGDRTDLTVDANDDLKSVTRPGNLKTTLTYGSGHLLTGETDASGGVHAFDYDNLGYVTKDTDPDGIATSASFSSLAGGQEIKLTEPSGRVRKFFSSGDTAHGYTHKVTHPWGAQTTTDYGPDGSVTATLTDGRTTTIQAGNDPRFGALGRVPADTSVKEPSGLTLDVHRNRTTTLSEPADPFSVSSSSDRWQLGSSQPVFRNYDGATRTFTVTDASGHVDTRTFDAKGHVASIKPDGQSTQTVTTDSQGRAASTAVGDMSESYTYDSKSQLASKTDALNHTTHYTYDAAGRMASVQLPGGQTYQYEHDGLDRLTKLTVPSGAFSQLAYTAAGRPQRFTPPGAGSGYAIGYDNDGEANKVTLPSGRALDFTRDTGGRVSSASYPGATIGVSYTGNDLRPATVTRTPTAGTAQGVAFGWDGDRMTSQTWSGATSGTYDLTYDSNLMLSQSKVTAAGSSYTSAIAHDSDGRVTAQGPFTFTRGGPSGAITAISGGPLSVTQSWDALGRLAGHADTVNAVGTYTSALQRDAASRITQKTETVAGTTHTFTYAYNANGQVTDVNRDGTNVEHYAYDADGNRTTRTAGGSTQTATYDSAGKITALGGTTYGVDQDGFVTQRGNDTFTYSAHGEILTAAVGGPTETYGYDGLHRLVSRTVAAGTWHYLYGNPEQQFQVTAAIEPSGTLDTLEYTDTGYLFSILRGSTRYYVSTDQVGSPRVVSDANGLVVKNVEYTAWGETTDSAPAFPLPIGFGGGIADPEAGLVHMGIRAYDPKSGRFMARDPIGLGGGAANLWDYAAGDPIQRSDPLGLASGSIGFCEGVCLGGKLAVTSKGLSFCFEVGVGGGGGVEISPAGNLDDNKLYAKASAEASLGPLAGIEISEELSTDGDCTKSTPGAKLCALGACLSTDPEATVDMSKIADLLKKAGHAGIEGKLVEGVCQNLLW